MLVVVLIIIEELWALISDILLLDSNIATVVLK
jgi:hypothetical protein